MVIGTAETTTVLPKGGADLNTPDMDDVTSIRHAATAGWAVAAGGLLAGGAEQHPLLEGVHPLHGTQLFGACGLGESSQNHGIGAVFEYRIRSGRRTTPNNAPPSRSRTADRSVDTTKARRERSRAGRFIRKLPRGFKRRRSVSLRSGVRRSGYLIPKPHGRIACLRNADVQYLALWWVVCTIRVPTNGEGQQRVHCQYCDRKGFVAMGHSGIAHYDSREFLYSAVVFDCRTSTYCLDHLRPPAATSELGPQCCYYAKDER